MRCQSTILFGPHSPIFEAQLDTVLRVFDGRNGKPFVRRARTIPALTHTRRVAAETELSLRASFIASDALDAIIAQLEEARIVSRREAKSCRSAHVEILLPQLDAVIVECHGFNGEQQSANEFS